MELAPSDSASWFVSLFHQYSLTIGHWQRLSDSKSAHVFQLQERLGALETELRELRSSHAKQSEAIAGYREAIGALEYELECQRQSASAFCNAPLPGRSPLQQEMHPLENCYLPCSPSRLMMSETLSPDAAITAGDNETCEAGEGGQCTRKRRRTDDGE